MRDRPFLLPCICFKLLAETARPRSCVWFGLGAEGFLSWSVDGGAVAAMFTLPVRRHGELLYALLERGGSFAAGFLIA
jgi:hypothetical protein